MNVYTNISGILILDAPAKSDSYSGINLDLRCPVRREWIMSHVELITSEWCSMIP